MLLRRVDNPPDPYTGIHQEWLEEPPLAEGLRQGSEAIQARG